MQRYFSTFPGLRLFVIIALLPGSFSFTLAQVSWNTNLIANWDDNTLPVNSGVTFNDIWGYAAGGREYAIMGSLAGTYFFDITNPATPVQVNYTPGAFNNCIWRDFKIHGNYAYGVADAGASTLQIFDLSGLPATVTKVYDSNAFFARAHNIYIENGRLYVAGSNTNNTGIIVLDISITPASPVLIGNPNLGKYSHDIHVRNNIGYCFMGNSNGFEVWDFTIPSAPVMLGNLNVYPEQGYCHSGWLSQSGNELVFADETHDKGLKIANVSNPASISVLSVFRSAMLSPTWVNSIVHNPFVKGRYVYLAYYHEGVQIYDIFNPAAPVKVAYYDTNPTNTWYIGYEGAWGVYPYLPSGRIIASDVRNGLFIFSTVGLFPVEYGQMSIAAEGRDVLLRWSTLTESNSAKFEIERSFNGVDFAKIAELQGAGTTSEETFYNYRDIQSPKGDIQYRFKQIDLDGAFKYSEVLSISIEDDFSGFTVFPNPAEHNQELQFSFTLSSETMVNASLFDMMGKKVAESKGKFEPGSFSLDIPTTTITPGAYLARLTGPRTQVNKRVIIY